MSGHSKWSTIKRKKEVRDHARGNVFTKLANAIVVAVKKGGSGDVDSNFALRLAVDKARSFNMPNENIKRAIDRGLGKGGGGKEIEELLFEGYGPFGVAVVVMCLTDNRTRTVTDLKVAFDRGGGKPAQPGSVLYQFQRVGSMVFEGLVDDSLYLELIDIGLIDMEQGEGEGIIYSNPEKIGEIIEKLRVAGLKQVEGEVVYKAENLAQGVDEKIMEEFIDKVKDIEDVQEVYAAY